MKTLIWIFLVTIITALNANNNPSVSISKQELINFLRPSIGQKIIAKEFDIIIEQIPPELTNEDINLVAEAISDLAIPAQQRSFQVSLKLKSGVKTTISGKIEWLTKIPILLRPIGPNDTINLSDVGYQDYPIDQLAATVVMDASELVGKDSAHTIVKPGLPVDRSLLKNPTIIKRGDIVEVVYRSQYLTVSAKALATQDLACGDTGTFETQHDSKQAPKKISAKVVGPSTAEIVHGST